MKGEAEFNQQKSFFFFKGNYILNLKQSFKILLTWIRPGSGSGLTKFCGSRSGSGYNQIHITVVRYLSAVWHLILYLSACLASCQVPVCLSGVLFSACLPAWHHVKYLSACLASCLVPVCLSGILSSTCLPVWHLVKYLSACLTSCQVPVCLSGRLF